MGIPTATIRPLLAFMNALSVSGLTPFNLSLKEQCVHRLRFGTLQHASRVIGDWIGFYNRQRPLQALAIKNPAEAYALSA